MVENQNRAGTVSETIAAALVNSGVKVVTYVPGSGANEVFVDYNKVNRQPAPISFHEEVAYSVAHGAALTGTRAATLLKSHGLVKASNSVTDSLYCGTTAGLVNIVFNDSKGQHSDSILDIRAFLKGIGIPCKVAQKRTIYQQIISLFAQSEKRRLPYALVVETEEVLQSSNFDNWPKLNIASPEFHREITQHVLCPFFADYQNKVLKCKKNREDWTKIPKPGIPRIPDSLPAEWKTVAAAYAGLFSVFQSVRGTLVVGDTGVSTLFACEPFNCIDITTYMGGSIPLAVGAYLGGRHDVWALTGDFSFIAAGHLGLLEAWQRRIPLKILIFYNGKAETTGGQPIPEKTLETILCGYSRYISYIRNPENSAEVKEVLNKAGQSTELKIVVADYRRCSR